MMSDIHSDSYSGGDVTFVVFTCMRPEDLDRCLESVVKQTVSMWDLVVVNNGSDAETDEVLGRYPAKVIRDGTKRLSYLFNIGWRDADRQFLAYLADDVVIERDWLEKGLDTLQRRQDAGVVTGPLTSPSEFSGEMHRLYAVSQRNRLLRRFVCFYDHFVMEGSLFEPGKLCDSGAYTMGQAFAPVSPEEKDIDLATTSGMVVRRSALQEISGFDEHFQFNHADGDLFVRMKRAGYAIVYNPAMLGVHYTRPGPSRYPQIIGRDTAFFYLKDIRPRTWRGRFGFLINVLVLNAYWIYKAFQARDIGQLRGISGFFRGIVDYLGARSDYRAA